MLEDLAAQGQSIWFDYIRRSLIDDGDLAALVVDGITGVTSNPAIFEKAVTGSTDYDEALRGHLAASPSATPEEMFEALAVADVRDACDVLRPVYDATRGGDGFVSLEVSPRLAHDTEATIVEARRLWSAVDRPNLMIKVPATAAGIPAVEELIASGVNVNVTLIFAIDRYEEQALAYRRGLERAADPGSIASVASFFVSRVDTAVDRLLDEVGTEEAAALRGTIAVANAKLAYEQYRALFGEPFEALRAAGARAQRPLWASTGTKDPAYSDVLYVEELIGPDTVNTAPPATIDAFVDHGKVRGATLLDDIDGAHEAVDLLDDLGIDIDAVTDRLLADGVQAFADAYERLIAAIDARRRELSP
jgi:transaldolase